MVQYDNNKTFDAIAAHQSFPVDIVVPPIETAWDTLCSTRKIYDNNYQLLDNTCHINY